MNKDKLKLQISVGSSYDSAEHKIMLPNDDSRPYFINTSHFTGRICIRIKDFKGIAPSDDIVFGNDFDKKINLPFGSSISFIPWNKINLYEEPIIKVMNGLPSWPSSNGEHIEENVNCPSEDFNDVAVTLPGFKLGVLQYWEGQPVRYVRNTTPENHPDIVNFTPKTGARWASQKSPTSLFPFTKSKKEVFLSPSPMSLSPAASIDSNKFNAAFERDDMEDDIKD
ncbi:unnamed protein product [Rhizophagus irregularis]|nr:unnamed protein product [Rhizophagus irregularis]